MKKLTYQNVLPSFALSLFIVGPFFLSTAYAALVYYDSFKERILFTITIHFLVFAIFSLAFWGIAQLKKQLIKTNYWIAYLLINAAFYSVTYFFICSIF